MVRAGIVLVCVAALVATLDLAHKASAVASRGDELLYHERSLGYVAGIAVASVLWCAALVATRSVGLALAGGLLLGGAVGNALSTALWDGAPNPFLVADETRALAFNLADVFVVAGTFVVLPIALVAFVARNRGRLGERVRFR